MILQKINNRKGFTLLELIIAIAITLIIFIAIPQFIKYRQKSIQTIIESIIIQQEEKIPTPSKQQNTIEQKGDMNKL